MLGSFISSSFQWFTPEATKTDQVRLLESISGINLENRIVTDVDLPLQLLKTGDILISRQFDGHSTEMMLLDGGMASHAAMLARDPRDTK
jgi:hypothetical protein